MSFTQCLLTLRGAETQDPVTDPEFDIPVRLEFKSWPPVGMLVVIVRVRCVSVKINQHDKALYVVLFESCVLLKMFRSIIQIYS